MAKFISLFSGVGGIDLGMEQAGHECVAQVEWDKNAAGVLKHRWPNVPLFCDVSKVSADDLPDCEFITYGFPCQDLSIAGQRKGLDGKRSGLFYEATRIIKQLAERAIRRGGVGGGRFIALAENVKGLLSSGDGYDFARCIRELHNIGASEVGWSVLDSQFFGVAQRRKRVFLVADFGGESTSEILAFSEGVSGHPPPSREAGKGTAGDATKGVGEGGTIEGVDWYNNAVTGDINHTLKIGGDVPGVIEQKETYCLQGGGETSQSSQGSGVNKDVAFTLNGLDKYGVVSWNGDTTPTPSEDVSVTLRSQQGGEGVGVAHGCDLYNCDITGDKSMTLKAAVGNPSVNLPTILKENLTVRRLTPIECERLQGFPDNWTSEKMELILEGNEWKATGKVVKQADGPRYRQQGNAVTVNVAEWIGKQIGKVLNETK
jgi:DNA (cytosine-5)-methyltransferase 1